jgi:hypothetical protein
VADRLRVREIDDDEGRRLVRIVRRGSGSVVTWRRAQMVLLSAQGMDAAAIAKVAFTSEDRVRDVIRNFNADGFSSLYPKYKGGRPPKFSQLSGWPGSRSRAHSVTSDRQRRHPGSRSVIGPRPCSAQGSCGCWRPPHALARRSPDPGDAVSPASP